ncbi:MAG: hypothetical protein EXR75_09435 [Myxococcales bacterium]|nr:hypothetical protein [Myxococcales bacterium]
MAKRGKDPQKTMIKRDPELKKKRRAERELQAAEAKAAGKSLADTSSDEDEVESDGGDVATKSTGNKSTGSTALGEFELPELAVKSADDEPEPEVSGAPWVLPFARFERKWTWLETRMLMVTLSGLIGTLCFWFAMRGMKDPVSTQSATGTVWRALFGMVALGGLVRFTTKKLGLAEKQRTIATVVAVVAGALLAKTWRAVGIDYFTALLDWLQQGSSICLFGGLKGISTRLTMLVSLIGASLACSAGTHINVDLAVRLIPKRFGRHAHIAGCLGAALVCFISSWGFFDFTAVSGFKAPAEASAGAKFSHVVHHVSDHGFLLRKQLGFDLGAVPYVIQGERWNADARMNGRQWNAYLDEAGFVERYGAEKVAGVRSAESELDLPRRPFVVEPGGSAPGALIHTLDLIFTVGFLMIGLRFLLRALLVHGGAASHDPHAQAPPAPPPAEKPKEPAQDAALDSALAKEAA